ncbi:aldehyde dehydrogenase family protein [Zavarzinia compransoris]|uniref:aldehyde dehydrogenase family protein n=1 Tax=Zavarzinia marina TaxID=2911065 RepID=UPI001F485279|nr:aldehyde dehydrogenase family protein [Zavarzinia marina]MCF4166872.1 aldehyde dehydrogenase family protein [Zavarzinia marina]
MDFTSDFTMTIGGKPVAGATTMSVLNPATEQVIAEAPDCSRAQLDEAVAAARAAFPAWKATPFEKRRDYLNAVSARIFENLEGLKRLLTLEQGKPIGEAEFEVGAAGMFVQGTASLRMPESVNEDSAERRSITRHVPIGVVGAISPWNFPVVLAFFKVGPALLAGNTVVLKPSPFTPLTTLKIGEMLRDVLPPGVLNIVSGGDALGPWMTSHPGIDKVSFTGSTQTGRKVMESASASLKRVTLELGGNDAAIVLPDVDVATLAPNLFWAAFANNGQICIASKRMYIHKDVYEPLRDAIVDYAKTVKVGDGAEQGTQIGPVQNKQQYRRVLDLIEDSKKQGHKFLLGGEAMDGPGYFVPVTILDNPPEDSRIVQEEQFGPVLPLLKVEDIDEAVAKANASEYGLGGSVWSGDPDKALAVGERLETGTVWINETQHLSPLAPFAGHKQSGVGVENGVDGLLEYTNVQTVVVRKA